MKRLVAFFALTLALTQAHGANYDELIRGQSRPAVRDVRNLVLPTTEGIPIVRGRNGRPDYSKWLATLKDGAPRFISQLELIAPGATWAFLGRDTEALADAVEAFYLSIGQPNRVVRMGVSKPTFWIMDDSGKPTNLYVKDEQILKWLQGFGFDLNNLNGQQPFWLVDTLSQGVGRQGRVILNAVYREHVARGGDPAALVNHFNMIGLATSTYSGKNYDAAQFSAALDVVRQFYNDNAEFINTSVKRGMNGTFFFENAPMIPLTHAENTFHESGYEHYTGAWHGRFGSFTVDANGKIVAQPGEPNREEVRRSILWFQKHLVDYVSSPYFLQLVEDHARGYGYEFPLKRPRNLFGSNAGENADLAALAEEIKQVDRELGRVDLEPHIEPVLHRLDAMGAQENRPGVSSKGQAIATWFTTITDEETLSPDFAAIATLKIINRSWQSLTANDHFYLVRDILMKTRLSTPFLAEVFASDKMLTSIVARSERLSKDELSRIEQIVKLKQYMDDSDAGCASSF